MNSNLTINKTFDNEFVFKLDIYNSSNDSLAVPISKLRRSGPQVGIMLIKEDLLEPISHTVISPATPDEEINLIKGQNYTVEYKAKLKKVGKVAYGLDFSLAMYIVQPGESYKVQFSLEGIVSNEIKYVFEV